MKSQRLATTIMKIILTMGISLLVSDNLTCRAWGQEKPAPAASDRASRPLIRVPTALPLDEARILIEAAKAVVKADNGRAAIAVVDFNGNLVSLDAMDGTSGFWVKFAIGKAMGAVTLQQTTAESADQLQTNPQRFHSALSLMEGQIILGNEKAHVAAESRVHPIDDLSGR